LSDPKRPAVEAGKKVLAGLSWQAEAPLIFGSAGLEIIKNEAFKV